MKNQSKEKQRAFNIIWNASGDYSFPPDFEAYDGRGLADLYWNYIYGAVRKYYDYSRFQGFFNDLKKEHDHVFYESLTWIGLENCAYEKAKKDRPVLADLRRNYSKKVLYEENAPSYYYLVDEIKIAHFQRVLGEEPKVREQVINILNDLEFDESLNTEQIILKMNEIIAVYFPFSRVPFKKSLWNAIFSSKNNLPFANPFLKLYSSRSNRHSQDHDSEEKTEKKGQSKSYWRSFLDQRNLKKRESIQDLFGASILSETQIKALEQMLCVGSHTNCHLHFTRGEYDANSFTKAGPKNQDSPALKQREKNKKHYRENLTRNSTSIAKLTNMIRNTILVNLESSFRADSGKLVAGKIWRNLYLYDSKVFLRNRMDDIGNLTVDIMLDASGSQMNRQEILASQGYIIAESLTRCNIPVRVYAFSTFSNYTIINIFRDYAEVDKNDRIFNYHTRGCNRDGLAIRTALHLMENSPCEHKVLIVLSDGKPVDPQGISEFRPNLDLNFYGDTPGVNDTALEVRKGWQKGISILGVFTGLDEDIPAARKIYGHNLVCIKSPERFADMVSILIQNKLKNL